MRMQPQNVLELVRRPIGSPHSVVFLHEWNSPGMRLRDRYVVEARGLETYGFMLRALINDSLPLPAGRCSACAVE